MKEKGKPEVEENYPALVKHRFHSKTSYLIPEQVRSQLIKMALMKTLIRSILKPKNSTSKLNTCIGFY